MTPIQRQCPSCKHMVAIAAETCRFCEAELPPVKRSVMGRTAGGNAIKGRRSFSQASDDGRCPRCGGLDFKAKRSVKGKVGLGLLAPKSQVRCVACGLMFKRK